MIIIFFLQKKENQNTHNDFIFFVKKISISKVKKVFENIFFY